VGRCHSFSSLAFGRQVLPRSPITTRSTTTALRSSSLPQSSTSDASTSGSTKFSGPGTPTVDMNRYNLPLEQIAEEWTAIVVPQSSLREEGIYLGAKSSKDIMVDTIKVSYRRTQRSLGLELLEIAGGREDGLGITVISGIVKDGPVDGKDVMVGDSIVAVSVIKAQRTNTGSGNNNGMTETQVTMAVSTECFGYDSMVEAIGSLPLPSEDDDEEEFIVLTLKRLRRKPKILIQLQYPPNQNEPDTTIELFAGENLRRAMLTRGIKLNDKLSLRFDSGGTGDCGADGTCATCVVGIVQGDELVSPQGTQEKQILKKNPRWRLACKAVVGYGYQEGEMTIRVNPRQW